MYIFYQLRRQLNSYIQVKPFNGFFDYRCNNPPDLTGMLEKRSKLANLMFVAVSPMLFECFSNIPSHECTYCGSKKPIIRTKEWYSTVVNVAGIDLFSNNNKQCNFAVSVVQLQLRCNDNNNNNIVIFGLFLKSPQALHINVTLKK